VAPRVNIVHPLVQALVAAAALVVIGAGVYASAAVARLGREVSGLSQRFDRALSGLDAVSRTAEQLEHLIAPSGSDDSAPQAGQQLRLTYQEMQKVNEKLDAMNGQLATANENLLAIGAGVRRTPERH
jgi:prefoldin subunit 5